MGLGFAGMAAPFVLPIGLVMFDQKVHAVSNSLIGWSFLVGLIVGIALYIYALRVSIRVRSIDDDGLLGLDNIHPDVRAEIVARGDAAIADAR